MNISKNAIIIIIILAVLYYAITQQMLDTAESFGIITKYEGFDDNEVEPFCVGGSCGRHGRYNRYNRYYSNYYDRYYYPIYDPYYYSGYNSFWSNPFGYLPCINTVYGGTYCW